ncbi:uncharacterized protein LOC128503298 [Spea bombifrons]|uniref:uncharacterized protein LOC128503298 n=1 Tax=Spea bombifrons TaxID=233779 RepID=UPI00234BE293|nr:uncharacterized protein LOC128503298 [Spea bombifrons]
MTIVCLHHTILLTLVFFFQNTFGDIQRIYGALGGQVFIPASAHAHPEGDQLECGFTREGGKKPDVIILCNIKNRHCEYPGKVRFELLFDNFVILLRDLRREDSGIYSCTITENSSNPITISSNLQVLDNISESLTMKNRTEDKNVTEFNETSSVMKKWVYGLSISILMLAVCSFVIINFAYKATAMANIARTQMPNAGIRMRWSKGTFFNLYLGTTVGNIVAAIAMFVIWIQGGPVPALSVAIVAFTIGFVLVFLSLVTCSFINRALLLFIINASSHFMNIVIFFTSIIGIATMATDTRNCDINAKC